MYVGLACIMKWQTIDINTWGYLDAQDALCSAILSYCAGFGMIPLMKWSQTCVITLQNMYVGLAYMLKWQNG